MTATAHAPRRRRSKPPTRRQRVDEARSFDHRALVALPEYHAARQAIAALLAASLRVDVACAWTGAAWVTVAADMIRTSYAADWCPYCDPEAVDPTCWPHTAEVDPASRWMFGHYRCPRGHRWTMGYTTDLALLAVLP
jgi:hypothetical protein